MFTRVFDTNKEYLDAYAKLINGTISTFSYIRESRTIIVDPTKLHKDEYEYALSVLRV